MMQNTQTYITVYLSPVPFHALRIYSIIKCLLLAAENKDFGLNLQIHFILTAFRIYCCFDHALSYHGNDPALKQFLTLMQSMSEIAFIGSELATKSQLSA